MTIEGSSRGWTPDEPSREGRVLPSSVGKTHAITLVLEFTRDVKRFPAVLLALILVGWRANSRRDGHPLGAVTNSDRGNHSIARSVNH